MDSNLETISFHEEDSFDFGRRLREIFDERKLSLRAFARYYGSSKDVVHRIMTGNRYTTKSELVKIAQSLKLSFERFSMGDTKQEMKELVSLIKHNSNPSRAIQLADIMLSQALGYTERFHILNNLGAVYHQINKHEQAHNTWLQALPYAEKIKELHDDSQCLYKITFNLILSHSKRKDYLRLAALLERVEPAFTDADPEKWGYIMYYRAKLALDQGDVELFRSQMYRVAELYRMTSDSWLHDTARNNIAFAEYLAGNLHKAEELYSEIMKCPSEHKDLEYLSRKGYVQTLLKVKKRTAANLLIEKSLQELEHENLPNMKAHFLLLHSYTHNDMTSAKRVLEIENVDESYYLMACKCLIELSERVMDREGFMKYHQMAGGFTKTTPFHEEVLQV